MIEAHRYAVARHAYAPILFKLPPYIKYTSAASFAVGSRCVCFLFCKLIISHKFALAKRDYPFFYKRAAFFEFFLFMI